MKKINRTSNLIIALCVLALFVSSCSEKKEKKQEAKQTEELIKQEMQSVAYTFPSMFELTNMLNDINASYIISLTNDPEQANTYVSEQQKALNLGSYALDLAYATTYNRQQEVKDYFGACEVLIRGLDLTDAYDSSLADDIKNNIDNKDELVDIISDMFERSYSYLNEQGRTELSYLVLSGSVFEGLYLATNISENAFNNPKVIRAILSQKESIAKLQTMMEKYKDAEDVKDVYSKVAAINKIYNMTEGSAGMTQEQIEKMTALVTSIRAEYIK